MGKLIVIPTPIGNLEDITLRSLKALEEVDVLLAEDTRTTGNLLKHFNVQTPLRSFHMHNEHRVVSNLVEQLESGRVIGLVSDAGTPGISDPGFLLVRAAIAANIPVECLPGATAFVPALVTSGLPTDRFVFEGFLPPKKGRQTKFQQLATEKRTVVFYESPHKLLKTLGDLKTHFGADRQAVCSREISKKFEEHIRGTIDELLVHFEQTPPRGEFVVVVAGNSEKQ